MPTSKPRLTVTLEPHLYELLRRLASLQGVSASSILVDLLGTVEPVMERVCVSLENANNASKGINDNLRRVAQQAESFILPQAASLINQIDILLDQIAGAGASADASSASSGRSVQEQDPRTVITGVRSPNPTPPKKIKNPVTKISTAGKAGEG